MENKCVHHSKCLSLICLCPFFKFCSHWKIKKKLKCFHDQVNSVHSVHEFFSIINYQKLPETKSMLNFHLNVAGNLEIILIIILLCKFEMNETKKWHALSLLILAVESIHILCLRETKTNGLNCTLTKTIWQSHINIFTNIDILKIQVKNRINCVAIEEEEEENYVLAPIHFKIKCQIH